MKTRKKKIKEDYMTKNKKNPGKYLQNGKKAVSLHRNSANGGLAQLARALAWHARGHRFESDILHFLISKATV